MTAGALQRHFRNRYHDVLTGLPNRDHLQRELLLAMCAAKRKAHT